MDNVTNIKRELNRIVVKVNTDHCDIKYSVYRTSLKLCQLQALFHLQEITSSSIFACMKNHITQNEDSLQHITTEVVELKKLHQIVTDIIKSSGIQSYLKTDKLVNYLTVLIFETFKDIKQDNVAVIAVVLFFIVMGRDDIQLKYKNLYTLYAGSLGLLSRSRTGLLLTHLIQITNIVNESVRFGKIAPAVESCFDGVLGAMISLHHFLEWLLREPQSIVWLPTMHRLNLSKTSVHNVECSACKIHPIVGLRFQCLKCFEYNSCQTCFLTQQNIGSNKSHKLNHPRQEYCLPAGSKEKVNAFARTIRNIVTKRYKRKSPSLSYLPISQDESAATLQFSSAYSFPENEMVPEDINAPSNVTESVDMNVSADFGEISHLAVEEKKQLVELVKKLKKENKKMSGTAHLLKASSTKQPNSDNDQILLQSKLDTLTLHNQGLQAELDNLKCVVFADNFLRQDILGYSQDNKLPNVVSASDSTKPVPEANISCSSSSSEHNYEMPTKAKDQTKKKCHQQKEPKFKTHELSNESLQQTDCTELRNKTEGLTPETQLSRIVEKLADSLNKNLNLLGSKSAVNHEICVAAEKVKDRINTLIDQALLI